MATVTIIVPVLFPEADGSLAISDDTAEVRRIRCDRGRRAHGINVAASECASDYIVMVAEGLEVRESGIRILVDYAKQAPRAGAVGGLLVAEDGSVLQAGIAIGPDCLPRPLYRGVSVDHPAVSKSRRMQVMGTEWMLVRRTAWNDVGGLDESLVDAYLDVDFCLRLQEFGWETHFCHECVGRMPVNPRALDSVSLASSAAAYREKWAHRVVPDEFQYYWDDGLIRFEQHMLYPLEIELAPPLSAMYESADTGIAVEMLQAQSQRMLEMVQDNIRMKTWCERLNRHNGKMSDPMSDGRP